MKKEIVWSLLLMILSAHFIVPVKLAYAAESDEVAVKAAAITESEGRAWLDAFHEQGAQGPIVAGRLHIFVWGRKPT